MVEILCASRRPLSPNPGYRLRTQEHIDSHTNKIDGQQSTLKRRAGYVGIIR